MREINHLRKLKRLWLTYSHVPNRLFVMYITCCDSDSYTAAPCSATTTTNLDARAVYASETTRSPPLPSFSSVFTFLDSLFLP